MLTSLGMDTGAALRGPEGQVAVRMGPNVTAGDYFVIDPVNGGYYAPPQQVPDIEGTWTPMVNGEPPAPPEPAEPLGDVPAPGGNQ